MGFKANNIEVKGVSKNLEDSSSTLENNVINVELTQHELELILTFIKNGLFKGEYVEILYNLTLKLQNSFLCLKQ